MHIEAFAHFRQRRPEMRTLSPPPPTACIHKGAATPATSDLLQRCLKVETPDSGRFYEITLFSECAVIPFLQ